MPRIVWIPLLLAAGCSETPGELPAPVACAAWAKGLSGAGVVAASGSVADQRARLLAAGGGVATVGTKYYAAYFPSSFAAAAQKRVMINLHGTGGAPEAEWNDFAAMLDARGWGYLGLKYLDNQTMVYDTDETIYANLVEMIHAAQASCELAGAKFHVFGFSRGSAKTFAMAALDNGGAHLFSGYASASGGAWQQPSGCAFMSGGTCAWQPTSPLYPTSCAQIAPGASCTCSPLTTSTAPSTPPKPAFATTILNAPGSQAYAGSRFWLYCGERDYNGGWRSCSDMEMSKTFVESFGGTVLELYEAGVSDGCQPWNGTTCLRLPDTMCGHGSHKNQARALDHMWTALEAL